MKNILLFLLIVLSLQEQLTLEMLEQKIKETTSTAFVTLMLIYDSATPNGPMLQRVMEEIGKKKQGYFKIVTIDCNTEDKSVIQGFPYCGKDVRKQLPAIIYSEPPLNAVNIQTKAENQYKNHQYVGNLQEKSLYQFAIPLMKLYSINIRKAEDWRKFQQAYPSIPKILYFTDKEKISPFFKTLTAHFRDTIAFGHVFNNNSLCKQLGITKFPTLLLNGKENIQLTSNLLEMIQILKAHQGKSTEIYIQEYQNLISELNAENFNQKIMENPSHILIHIAGADGKAHPQWKKCQENFKKMLEYYDGTQLKDQLGVKSRPAIIYYPKSLAKKQLKKTIFYSNNNFRNIYDEVQGLIDDFTVAISNEIQFQQLTSISLAQGRLIVILFHKEQISLSYRVLSNHEKFKEVLTFFRMKNPAPEIVKQYQIKKLPSLFVMTIDEQNTTQTKQKPEDIEKGKKGMNLKIASFGGKFNYDELQTFLNHFVTVPQDKKQEEPTNQPQLIEIKTKNSFNKLCNDESCYLLLLDESEQKKTANLQYINSLKKMSSKVLTNIAYVDAKCHSQLLGKLQIYAEDLPVLINLNSKFLKYSRLIGRIQEKSIEQFFAKVKTNKGIWRPYEKLQLNDLNCFQEHKRLKELQTSSYQMSAEDAQILQEIKKEQQKKKQEAGIDGTQKKKKKKRRPKQEDSDL